jgi:hypothetical protein
MPLSLDGGTKQIEVAFSKEGNLRLIVEQYFIANFRQSDKFFLHGAIIIAPFNIPRLVFGPPGNRRKTTVAVRLRELNLCPASWKNLPAFSVDAPDPYSDEADLTPAWLRFL